jgi:glycosyltransferase involved in cell wall biosynthesis
MNIAIDATSIPRNKTGVGVYLVNLINEISNLDANNSYYIFVQSDDVDSFNIEKDNFHLIIIDSNKYRKVFLRLFWEQIILPKKLKEYDIDILHSPHYTSPVFTKVSRVVTFHDMTFYTLPKVHTFFKRLLFKIYMKISSKIADKIVTVSESTAKDVEKILDVSSNKTCVTYNAKKDMYKPINNQENIVEVCSKYNIRDNYVLFVGTLEPRKNIKTLIKSYSKLIKEINKEIKLVVVGKKGWMYKEIFELMRSLGIDNQVIFTGFADLEDLPYLYNGAEVFVYPSIYEGFGIPVLEAISCGTPTITSNVSSMPEVIGDAGITVNPNDVDELKDAIKRIIEDDDLKEQFRKQGIEQAKKFTWKNCAKDTLQVYKKINNM